MGLICCLAQAISPCQGVSQDGVFQLLESEMYQDFQRLWMLFDELIDVGVCRCDFDLFGNFFFPLLPVSASSIR